MRRRTDGRQHVFAEEQVGPSAEDDPLRVMYEILGMHKSDIFAKAGQFWHGTPHETRILLAISNENLPPAPPDHVRTRQIS
jgi:hypothetical protein